MIGPEENNRLSQFIGGGLPRISDNEVLLENAFTTEAHRRKGIEIWTVKQLLEKAMACGVRRAILFVRDTNTVTQKIVQRLGFVPYIEKMDRRFLFFRKITFQPLSKE
jgi:L-amino acid N-acyltransferase YncA